MTLFLCIKLACYFEFQAEHCFECVDTCLSDVDETAFNLTTLKCFCQPLNRIDPPLNPRCSDSDRTTHPLWQQASASPIANEDGDAHTPSANLYAWGLPFALVPSLCSLPRAYFVGSCRRFFTRIIAEYINVETLLTKTSTITRVDVTQFAILSSFIYVENIIFIIVFRSFPSVAYLLWR